MLDTKSVLKNKWQQWKELFSLIMCPDKYFLPLTNIFALGTWWWVWEWLEFIFPLKTFCKQKKQQPGNKLRRLSSCSVFLESGRLITQVLEPSDGHGASMLSPWKWIFLKLYQAFYVWFKIGNDARISNFATFYVMNFTEYLLQQPYQNK